MIRQSELLASLLLITVSFAMGTSIESISYLPPPTNTDNGPISPDNRGFRERGLMIHNYYRELNNANKLQLDPELSRLAHAHAERSAKAGKMMSSYYGFAENLWSHRGDLLPLSKDLEYAIECWYTGSTAPGRVSAIVDSRILRSNRYRYVGFGVGTSQGRHGEGYTVVVALYK